jgi:hypothetical protein
MYEDFYVEPSTSAGPDAFLGVYFWLVAIALYGYFAYMQYRMAHKSGPSDLAWWAFIPIMNTLLLIKMAGKPMWWFILLFVPLVNIYCFFALWIGAAKNCGQPGIWGFLMMIPLLNLVAAFILAFSSRPYVYPDEAPSSPPKPRHPQQVG